MKAGVGVCTVAITASERAEDHVATFDGASVFDLQVNSIIMNFQSTFVVECLPTCITEHSSFPGGRPHPSHSVNPEGAFWVFSLGQIADWGRILNGGDAGWLGFGFHISDAGQGISVGRLIILIRCGRYFGFAALIIFVLG